MKRLGYIISFLFFLVFTACSGGGSSDEYFTPGITTTPPSLVVAEGDLRGAIQGISSYSFGEVSAPVSATFTFYNQGDHTAKLSRTEFGSPFYSYLGGTYPGVGGSCSLNIKSKASCTVVVRFAPEANSSVTARMSVYYTAKDGDTSLELLLSGSGGSAPMVTGVSPSVGPAVGGTRLSISGSGFRSGVTVKVGGNTCRNLSFVSDRELSCETASHAAGLVDIVVTNPDGQRGTLAGEYRYRAAPTVSGISPSVGGLAGGTTVTINGTGFLSGASVTIGGSECGSVNYQSPTQISCTTSARTAGIVTVTVTNTDSQSGTSVSTFTYQAAPTVTSISPSVGPVSGGTVITITGMGFLNGATVNLGGNTCGSILVNSPTEIVCTTAAHAVGAVAATVTNSDSQSGSLSPAFYYQAAPTVASVSPTAGTLAGGTTVTISGTGFLNGAVVDFGGSACGSVNVNSATELTCLTSAHVAGNVTVSVTNTDSQSGSKSDAYRYQAAPTITVATPNAGALAGNTLVTITGSGFLSGLQVSFGGVAATSITVLNENQLTCRTPAHATGLVDIVVTNLDGQTGTDVGGYLFQPAPTVTQATPNSGSTFGGTGVVITGTGFLSGASVTIGGVECTGVAVNSATQIACTTGAGTEGLSDIVVTNTDSQSGTGEDLFSYLAPTGDFWTAMTTTGAPAGRPSAKAVWTGSKMIVWGGWDGPTYFNTGGQYDPINDSWSNITTINAPTGRFDHSFVWTGSQAIVWGGWDMGAYTNTGGRYDPVADTWSATTTTNAPTWRYAHSTVWTGAKLIVFGGWNGSQNLKTGGQYDPYTDTWTATSQTNAPSWRRNAYAVWTGAKMVVWGGWGGTVGIIGAANLKDGGSYNPATDTWASISTTNAPLARTSGDYGDPSLWTGSKMIIWGGSGTGNVQLNTGALYDPALDQWTAMTTTNAPAGRRAYQSAWTGSRFLVWGGVGAGSTSLGDGASFDPVSGTWSSLTNTGAPTARVGHTIVWTGSKMLVWGGANGSNLNSGGVYTPALDPAANSWVATQSTGAPTSRSNHFAVWTGSKMIIWGGQNPWQLDTGALYDPVADSWTNTSTSGVPQARYLGSAVWTGSKMIVWGGRGMTYLNTGGSYDPIANVWTSVQTSGAPSARGYHSSVWTGSKMIIWGGSAGGSTYYNDGGIYDPTSDTWTATQTTDAPSFRVWQTCVWTGSKMIIWGGELGGALASGAVFDPQANSWTPTSSVNAPSGRYWHSAVWTGSRMVVWGGSSGGGGRFQTGGLYNPIDDSWTATSLTDVPVGRYFHSAVWTGSKMIIWGGISSANINTGAAYDPSTGQWSAIANLNAPAARLYPSVIWTGSKMIVWGGLDGSSEVNTGGVYTP